MKNELSYQKAYDELERIIAEIEQEKIQLDKLAVKMKRAKELLQFCREKLRDAESAIKEVEK
ncbi:MAG: exodeoxyribonuclease VII small subunit [Bacteroidales bacterium]